jgi:hypothetical protein
MTTEDRMALLALAEKAGEPIFLRELAEFTLQRLMGLEVEDRCGAGRYTRSDTIWVVRVAYYRVVTDKLLHESLEGYLPTQLQSEPGRKESSP